MNVWDMRLKGGASVTLDLPDGHNSALVVLTGHVTVGGSQPAGEAEMVLLSKEGGGVTIDADGDAIVLVLTGEPIEEPIVGYGPFVMNSEAEIRQAMADFNAGRFGQMAHA
jgi:redox-sensitive bicupin YhaK (pirin superfamily)